MLTQCGAAASAAFGSGFGRITETRGLPTPPPGCGRSGRTTLRVVLLLALTTAVADAAAFRFERPLTPGAPGPNRASIDVPLLAGAAPVETDAVGNWTAGPKDLRLYDTSGMEIPYLLVAPPAQRERWRRANIAGAIAPTKVSSGFEADLGESVVVDRLRISGLPAPFLKRVQLEGSADRQRWVLLSNQATLFDLPDEKLRLDDIEFAPGSFRYFRVSWDDRSSARMPLPATVEARILPPTAPAEPLRLPIPFTRRASEPGRSRFGLRLPAGHLPIRAVTLEVRSDHLLRAARITEGRLTGGEVKSATIGEKTLRLARRGDAVASDLRIEIARPSEAELELVTEDGDNPPLDLAQVVAQFTPLPYIYLEVPNAAPIEARYGNAAIQTPRYDLEAMRGSLSKVSPALASWEEPEPAVAASAEPAGQSPVPITGPAIVAADFRYSRQINRTRGGLQTLPLDAAVLAHSRNLIDIRLVDDKGRQVPYLVEKRDEPLEVPLRAVPAASAPPQTSRYSIALPYSGLPDSRLVLETNSRVFDRTVDVSVPSADERDRRDSLETAIASTEWKHSDPEIRTLPLTIDLPPQRGNALTLTIHEGDNPPLPIQSVRFLLPSYRLRFFAADRSALRLIYGNPTIAAPQYDLALVAPRVLGAPAQSVTASPETAKTAQGAGSPTEVRVFWGAVIAAAVVLFALLGRLITKAG
jgi:Protein of unknown function (DUF3999)